ncbi:Myristoyl-CoA:protein N-myristoyltransferase, N-terminal domain [seawater metagenome]|uniref:glycylpeptide N-tetradecanoyltransferase n=1 Tax=seawater metagenome TaxID=1561972 RepID=A0A5E8CIV0_9ZZZZ
MSSHPFWETQPVSNEISNPGLIDDKLKGYNNKNETPLPDGLEWHHLDINQELPVLIDFLKRHFMSINDCFTLNYQESLVKWFLDFKDEDFNCKSSPRLLSISIKKENKLLGYICAAPAYIKIGEKINETAIVNFLCIHKKLRKLRLAPLLIKELIRRCRVHLPHILISPIFTAKYLPFQPILDAKYYFRYLNFEKLNNNRFVNVKNYENYDIPTLDSNITFRPMLPDDISQAYELFLKNIKDKKLSIYFKNKEQFTRYFSNKIIDGELNGPIYTFVVTQNNKVTDWISCYSLPYQVEYNKNELQVLNLLRLEQGETDYLTLFNLMFKSAKELNFDLFCTLDFFDIKNKSELKFESQDVEISYYTFNYDCGIINSSECSLILP